MFSYIRCFCRLDYLTEEILLSNGRLEACCAFCLCRLLRQRPCRWIDLGHISIYRRCRETEDYCNTAEIRILGTHIYNSKTLTLCKPAL